MRRLVGKSDTLDAENAARAVLAGFATAEPKTADGTVEMIRQLKVAHDTAVKDRSSAMITLKAMLIHGSDQLRQDTARKRRLCSPATLPHYGQLGLKPQTTAFATLSASSRAAG